jgi:hypothetical protein
MMTFDLAYARINTTSSNTDKLVIYFSTNCGATWTPRYTKNGASLETTGGAVNTDFYPTSSDFRTETVSLVPTTISGRPNVRFRFEFTHDTGNNIYIDNINMTGTVGVDEINADNADVSIYPNPTNAAAYVDFNVQVPGKVVIDVMDAQGRVVSTFSDEMPSGDHQYTVSGDLAKGVYFVRLSFGDQSITKKVVIK